ncbi:Leucine-rich repeat-containing G-protein coupled receptor 4 [Holothuria leucospilota]|uniref:Leucine-rich repeat-containing G-protein coupled receptor 4 n=1 Tax=Holothuria leucospilota TaxID=206669 RepID=A0A9Q1CR69_HOLLE|nr:Leucine-rich repeat-containing G-protein coupled receptor 4 [Holothuria leucospilota]
MKFFSTSVQYIYFNQNALVSVDDYILSVLPSTQTLHFNNNQISNTGLFVPGKISYNLTALSLNYNKLRNIPVSFLRKLPNLEQLGLSWNRLNIIPQEAFIKNPQLRIINLAGNQIHFTHATSLKGLLNLEHLDLRFNHISSLPSEIFDPVNHDFRLLLRGNNFTCDCNIFFHQKWLEKTRFYVDHILCLVPEFGNYTRLISFEFDDTCVEPTSVSPVSSNETVTETSSKPLNVYWKISLVVIAIFAIVFSISIFQRVLKTSTPTTDIRLEEVGERRG